MLQGHTALVYSLQLTLHTLVTGGADGRVVVFALPDSRVNTRIVPYDSTITSLQSDGHWQFLVTDVASGAYV